MNFTQKYLPSLTTFETLADKRRLEMSLQLRHYDATIKRKLVRVVSANNKRKRTTLSSLDLQGDSLTEADDYDDEKEADLTRLPSTQKNERFELKDLFQRYVNTQPVFGFNSANYDLKFIELYLVPLLVNEKGTQLTVIKKDIGWYPSNSAKNCFWIS